MKSIIRSTTELAKLLGISRWTVSRALNGHAGISAETVRRVQELAKDHGFSPSVLGRGLRSGRNTVVGISLPDLVDYFLTSKIARLQETIASRGYDPVIQMTNGSEEREELVLAHFAAIHCAGVISIASKLKPGNRRLKSLESMGIRVIKIDPLHSGHPLVVSSNRSAAMKGALTYLHQLGHRQMVTLGIDPYTPYGAQRVEGLKEGCRLFDWKFRRDIRSLYLPEIEDDFDAGVILARRYLDLPSPRPRAILAINDRVAIGAMQCLLKNGIRVPEEVSVIGYDNVDFGRYSSPSLTSIDPQVTGLIDLAVELFFSKEGEIGGAGSSPLLVDPQLVVRDSTGP